jgi:hypothetical protein
MRRTNAVAVEGLGMDRSFDKDKPASQETVKHDDRKGGKHEGARENRPERPVPAEGETHGKADTYKRDEEQDKKIPHGERDEEQPKVLTGKPRAAGNKGNEPAGDDAPDMAQTESDNVVKTEPDDDEAPSQGI